MGGIWERFGRDKNHLSHPASPLYKGISKDYGRDEDKQQLFCLNKDCFLRNTQSLISNSQPLFTKKRAAQS